MATRPMRGRGLQTIFALILCCLNPSYIAGFHSDPRKEFYSHAVVYPTIYAENRSKREVRSTENQHEEKLTIGFVAFNKNYVVNLYMNKDLLPQHYFEKHQEDGENVIHKPMKMGKTHCYYQGHVLGLNHSWAAISTCNGVSGVIHDGEDLHYIEPDRSSENRHFFFKASDLVPRDLKCENKNQKFIPRSYIPEELSRRRRSVAIHPPYKSNSKSRFVEMIIVNDNKEYKKFNQSKKIVFERSKQIANIVNGLFSPLNIFVALVGVIVWSDHDEIKLSTDGDVTLTSFLRYRRERLAVEHPNDNAQLITAMTFDGGVVGKALKGPICTFEYSGGISMDHSDLVGLVATTVTHELGHNFGMEHDTDECQCPDEKCIMSPSSSSTTPRHWSSCSLDYLDHAFSQGMDYCLKNRPSDTIGPVCGNGFLEEGEECDCGLKGFCDNHCCNATSCRLYSNASCAMGGCCDVKTCQVKKAAVLCRETISECDLPEYCDGKSEFCPVDTSQQNGVECDDGKAYCYDGKCRSHADQCKLLWGQTGKMSDFRCYEQNYKGNVNGNCGYNRLNQTYKMCGKQDILCGMLHCTHLNEKLEFGMESAAILARSFITVRGKVFTCRSAIIDLGLHNTDPGLTPNGAKCGDGKLCVNQKCVSVDSVKGTECPMQCSGNGVCNNKGNCHCSHGYGPPYCNTPGSGGSIDSGPASDSGGYILIVVMYIVFLGILPLVIIAGAAIYYFRPHFKTWWITKARKANIKAKNTVQRKPQPPSKFNFDRNSLRTLEISSPIQQLSNAQNASGLPAPSKFSKSPVDRHNSFKSEIPNAIPQTSVGSTLQPCKPIPVRPAPPRPDAAPQCTPSWKPATAVALPPIIRTSSLRVASENARPVSLLTSRPNCPPPRPPPPKCNSHPFPPSNVTYPTFENVDSHLNNADRSETPNSAFYDDCQTLDFSNTPLAFVHQPSDCCCAGDVDPHGPSQHDKVQDARLANVAQANVNKNCQCATTPLSNKPHPNHASLVASLAQRFENQKKLSGTSVTSVRPSVKLRPLPQIPRKSQT